MAFKAFHTADGPLILLIYSQFLLIVIPGSLELTTMIAESFG